MLPTWREVEVQSELRKARLQEAVQMRLSRQAELAQRQESGLLARFLVGLGTWMMSAGGELRSRYGEAHNLEAGLHSIQQGC